MDTFLYILGQFFGIVAVVLGFVSFQMRTPRGILSCQIATASLFALHYFLINAITAMALNMLAAVMCVVYYFRDKRGSKSKLAPIFFTALVVAVSIFTWDKWYSVFIAAGLAFNAISLAASNPQRTRALMFIKSPLCLIYNIFTLSLGGAIYECVAFISSLIGIIRNRSPKEDKEVIHSKQN